MIIYVIFFFNDTATTEIYTLSLHDALPIFALAGAAALSHDLWVNVVRDGEAPEREQLRVARGATVVMGALAIVLGIVLEGQNVAFMVGLAFAIAASANFPALLMAIF